MYRLTSSPTHVERLSDNAMIPFDENNVDYLDYRKWLDEGNIPADYVPPPPVIVVPVSITRRQCALELLNQKLITSTEALEMTRNGIPPAFVRDILSLLSTDERNMAEIDFAADTYLRSNPLLNQLMKMAGSTDAEIDQFFISAATR